MPKQERGLGRGLDALFAGAMDDGDKDRVIEVEIKDIKARADQPRRVFNSEALQELADSLQEHGVLQPLLVRKRGKHYEIIAGERRWRGNRVPSHRLRRSQFQLRDRHDLDRGPRAAGAFNKPDR